VLDKEVGYAEKLIKNYFQNYSKFSLGCREEKKEKKIKKEEKEDNRIINSQFLSIFAHRTSSVSDSQDVADSFCFSLSNNCRTYSISHSQKQPI
jgi:hypothetical protein